MSEVVPNSLYLYQPREEAVQVSNPMKVNLNANNHRITTLGNPVSNQDAVNKSYVDLQVSNVETGRGAINVNLNSGSITLSKEQSNNILLSKTVVDNNLLRLPFQGTFGVMNQIFCDANSTNINVVAVDNNDSPTAQSLFLLFEDGVYQGLRNQLTIGANTMMKCWTIPGTTSGSQNVKWIIETYGNLESVYQEYDDVPEEDQV